MIKSLMNRAVWFAALLCLVLSGCAGQKALNAGDKYFQQGEYDLAMEQYATVIAEHPERHEYRMKWLNARGQAAVKHYKLGQQLTEMGNLPGAAGEYQKAASLDGSLTVAVQKLKEIQDRLLADQLIEEAESFYGKRLYNQAKAPLAKRCNWCLSILLLLG